MMATRRFRCFDCGYEWDVPFGTGQRGIEMRCPKCGSPNVHRIDNNPPPGMGYGQRGGRGRGAGQGRGQGRGMGRF